MFDGNAQELDHVIVNSVAAAAFDRLEYGRVNADFPESQRSDPNRPERLSDHDMVIAYFKTAPVQPPDQTPPVLTLPEDITVPAVRPSGTRVSLRCVGHRRRRWCRCRGVRPGVGIALRHYGDDGRVHRE